MEPSIEATLAAAGKTCAGRDSEGKEYGSISDMWKAELADGEEMKTASASTHDASATDATASADSTTSSTPATSALAAAAADELRWYSDANAYWEDEGNCPATVDGVLGGYGFISSIDVRTSTKFLKALRKKLPSFGRTRALDCGAGIGRVAKQLLLPLFDTVDLIEQSQRLISSARAYIDDRKGGAPASGEAGMGQVGELFCCGMQDHLFPDSNGSGTEGGGGGGGGGHYDVVWLQWVIGHFTDTDFIAFLQRAKEGLRPHGMICVKDNVLPGKKKDKKGRDAGEGPPPSFVVDKKDSSVTRADA